MAPQAQGFAGLLSLPLFEVSHLCCFALLGSAQPECSPHPPPLVLIKSNPSVSLDVWKLLPHTSLPLDEFILNSPLLPLFGQLIANSL